MAKVSALEVMPAFNLRSNLGRVVVEPPSKMPELKLRETVPMYLCCGRAFLSETSYKKHQEEVEVHGKPIDLGKFRTAKHDRSSLAFWRARKAKAAMTYEQASIARNSSDEDTTTDDEDDEGERNKGKSNNGRGPKRLRRTVECKECHLMIPSTNHRRHQRMCHDPDSEFKCKHCSCRFATTYGRMIHEARNHNHSTAIKLKTLKKQLIKPPPKLRLTPLTAASLPPTIIPSSSANGKINKFPGMKTLNKHAHLCLVCNKVVKGYQTAKDHVNIHKGLKPYSCPLCGFKFTHKSNMTRHLAKGHTGGEHFCENGCGYSFLKPVHAKYHRRFCTVTQAQQFNSQDQISSSNRKKPLVKLASQVKEQDAIVQVDFRDKEHLKNTIIQWQKNLLKFRQPNGLLVCPLCQKGLTGPANLRDHLNMHGGIKPHPCTLCSISFTFKCNIARHITQCHVKDGAFPCRYNCGCRMGTTSACSTHESKCIKSGKIMKVKRTSLSILSFSNKLPYPPVKNEPCEEAPKLTYSNSYVQSANAKFKKPALPSMLVKSTGKERPFTCTICGKWLISARNLRNHMMIHLNLKPHKCRLCGMAFRSHDQIKRHERISHVPTGSYRCPQCPCQFGTEQSLKFHVTSKHALKRRKPGLPLGQFRPVITKKENSRPLMPKLIPMGPKVNIQPTYETNKRTVIKKEADRNSNNSTSSEKTDMGSLAAASKSTSIRFPCDYCEKTFQSALNLKYHIYSHTGEKPFKCKDCGYHFRRNSTLWDHQKHSHGGGRYRCLNCTCRFASEIGLRRHNSIYHTNSSVMTKSGKKIALHRTSNSTTSGIAAPDIGANPRISNSRPGYTARKSVTKSAQMPANRSFSTTAYHVGSTTIAVSVPNDDKKNVPSPSKSNTLTSNNVVPDIADRVSAQNGITQREKQTADEKSSRTTLSKVGCGHCGLDFESIHELSEHQTLHTKDDVDEIEIEIEDDTNCDLEYQDQNFLNDTQTKDKDTKQLWKNVCPICQCPIHGASHYRTHMRGCHSGGKFRCEKCPCQFHKQRVLSTHYTIVHGRNRETSKSPQKSRIPRTTFMGEVQKGTEIENADASNFFQNHFLLGDITPDIEEDPLQTSGSNEEAGAGDILARYAPVEKSKKTSQLTRVKNNAQSTDRRFICDECGKGFKSGWQLKMHAVVHQTTYGHKCRICGQYFKTAPHVKHHMKKSHGNGKFKCSKCPSQFDTYRGLTTHNYCYHKGGREIRAQIQRKPHAKIKKYKQPLQNNVNGNLHKFSHSSSVAGTSKQPVANLSRFAVPVTEHPKFSPKSRPIKCKVCGEVCRGPDNLISHMRSHSGDFQEPSKVAMTSNSPKSVRTTEEVAVVVPVTSLQERIPDMPREESEEEWETTEADMESEDTVIMDYEDDFHIRNDLAASKIDEQESGGHLIRYELAAFDEQNFCNGNGDDTDDLDVDSYDCDGCGLSFTSRVAFLRHIQTSGTGPFKCPHCCATHASNSTLQGHLELYHEALITVDH